MKVKVTLKCPDALYDAVHAAITKELILKNQLDDEEEFARLQHEVTTQCAKWFTYGEYLSVEINTTADTITVLKNGE